MCFNSHMKRARRLSTNISLFVDKGYVANCLTLVCNGSLNSSVLTDSQRPQFMHHSSFCLVCVFKEGVSLRIHFCRESLTNRAVRDFKRICIYLKWDGLYIVCLCKCVYWLRLIEMVTLVTKFVCYYFKQLLQFRYRQVYKLKPSIRRVNWF
jgi:hypothetical protein